MKIGLNFLSTTYRIENGYWGNEKDVLFPKHVLFITPQKWFLFSSFAGIRKLSFTWIVSTNEFKEDVYIGYEMIPMSREIMRRLDVIEKKLKDADEFSEVVANWIELVHESLDLMNHNLSAILGALHVESPTPPVESKTNKKKKRFRYI